MENLTIGNRYLFDTCVFIEILRNRKPATRFYHDSRFLSIFVGYSIISETELWVGLKGFRTEYEHTKILRPYHRYFLNVTIARQAGLFYQKLVEDFKQLKDDLKQKKQQPTKDDYPPPLQDCIIAATAKFHNVRVVSSDKHMLMFRQFDVLVDHYNVEH